MPEYHIVMCEVQMGDSDEVAYKATTVQGLDNAIARAQALMSQTLKDDLSGGGGEATGQAVTDVWVCKIDAANPDEALEQSLSEKAVRVWPAAG
ncbi:MAG TPA: hypothetical protein VLW45_07030 [Pelomicrobium sp.]|nr:hypothetical protein [Pelomicrobium sp.]